MIIAIEMILLCIYFVLFFRCANCFDCPSCGHTLSVRATVTQAVHSSPLEEGNKATPPKKMHYLSCGFCRWTTRDVGLADQVTRKDVGSLLSLLQILILSTNKNYY